MAVFGADVAELRSTANQLTQTADRLENSTKSLNGIVSNVSIWRGQDADRFRSDWKSQSVGSLRSAVSSLRETADVLRRNAEQQEQASQADGGSTSSNPSGSSSTANSVCYEPAPQGLSGLWNELADVPDGDGMSGYRVQKVVGEDGVERYVVYIGGTGKPWELDNNQNWAGNINGINGNLDTAQVAALKRLIPEGAEVMLVGYSQGGIDAQNIAAKTDLNVTQIVTYGSPVRNDLNIPAIHLQDPRDIVTSSGAARPDLWNIGQNSGNDNVEIFVDKENRLLTVFGIGEHMGGYDDMAEKWDAAAASGADGRAAESAENLRRFQGDVTGQTDIKKDGKASW